MSEWQPIETAPKDGRVFLAYAGQYPQFVAWVETEEEEFIQDDWRWWRWRKVVRREAGFRILMPPARGMGFGIHGNYAPFTPTHWMPLPPHPFSGGSLEIQRVD